MVNVRRTVSLVSLVVAIGLLFLLLVIEDSGIVQTLIALLFISTAIGVGTYTVGLIFEQIPTDNIRPGHYLVYAAERLEEEKESFWFIFARKKEKDGQGSMEAYKLHAGTVNVNVHDHPAMELEVISKGRLTNAVLTLPKTP